MRKEEIPIGWVGTQLAEAGLATYALDLRGRGKSDGERFYVETFDDYVSDVAKCVTLAKSREPNLRLQQAATASIRRWRPAMR